MSDEENTLVENQEHKVEVVIDSLDRTTYGSKPKPSPDVERWARLWGPPS